MNKKGMSLKLKSFLVIVLAVVIGAVLYFTVSSVLCFAIDNYYLSDSLEEKRIEKFNASFQNYVRSNNVVSTDEEAIKEWCESNKYIYFMLFDDDSLRLVIDGDSSYTYSDGQITNMSGYDVTTIEFADGNFNVSIIEFSESMYYTMAYIISAAVAILTSFVILLEFLSHTVKRITTLSNKVSSSDFNNENLVPDRNDEIGELYRSVEKMKKEIVYHYENEMQSYNANKELITNMSHDIRTPLTSIIGYNEMMLNPDNTAEDMRQYAAFSLEKANQLKDMSDKLFKYFLVYDKSGIDVNFESISAELLIQQLIGEQLVIARQNGFDVVFNCDIDDVEILTDPLLLKRIFDNVFSNINKYADKEKTVKIDTAIVDGKVNILIINYISPRVIKKESTQIGLKSCKKIMEVLGGSIDFKSLDDLYMTTITI